MIKILSFYFVSVALLEFNWSKVSAGESVTFSAIVMRVLLIRLLRPAVFIPIIIFKNLKAILSPSLPSAISLSSSMLEVRREPRGPSFPPTISNIFPLDSNLSSFEFFSSVISLPSLIVALMAPSFPGRPVVTCSNPSLCLVKSHLRLLF